MSSVDPWRHVDVDDDLAADFLAGTVEAVLEAGGWIHPSARFVVRDGHGRVECEAPAGEPLLRVPRSAFVRIGRVRWTDDAEVLAFDEIPSEFDGAEVQLLLMQTAFHNACRKIPRLVATHPALTHDLPPELITSVRVFRPGFRRRQPTPAGLFWSNRVFRLPLDGGSPPEPVAIPLIDLLDHDHRGATGTWTADAFSVDSARPIGEHECRLDYGLRRDAIGMAVVYGFVADDSAVAHSAPLSIDVADIGHVTVEGRGRRRDGTLLPSAVRRAGEGLVISHVTFGDGEPSPDVPTAAITAIAQANLELLNDLSQAAARSDAPAAAILGQAAQVQSRVIRAAMG